MPREDFKDLDISSVVANIGNNWTSEDDAKVRKYTKSKKISDSQINIKNNPHTEETINKIRSSNLGKKRSDETKLKVSLSRLGKKFKPFTKEHKAKISLARARQILKPVSEETKAKQRLASTGRKQSPETIAKKKATRAANKLLSNSLGYKTPNFNNKEVNNDQHFG